MSSLFKNLTACCKLVKLQKIGNTLLIIYLKQSGLKAKEENKE
jgi:hypothetical protein